MTAEHLATRAKRIAKVLKANLTVPTERVINLLDEVADIFRYGVMVSIGASVIHDERRRLERADYPPGMTNLPPYPVPAPAPSMSSPEAWLWINPDGSKEVTFVEPEEDTALSTALALAMGRKAIPLYSRHPNASAMADEYQAWIDFFHAGEGDYNDFLRKYLPTEVVNVCDCLYPTQGHSPYCATRRAQSCPHCSEDLTNTQGHFCEGWPTK